MCRSHAPPVSTGSGNHHPEWENRRTIGTPSETAPTSEEKYRHSLHVRTPFSSLHRKHSSKSVDKRSGKDLSLKILGVFTSKSFEGPSRVPKLLTWRPSNTPESSFNECYFVYLRINPLYLKFNGNLITRIKFYKCLKVLVLLSNDRRRAT